MDNSIRPSGDNARGFLCPPGKSSFFKKAYLKAVEWKRTNISSPEYDWKDYDKVANAVEIGGAFAGSGVALWAAARQQVTETGTFPTDKALHAGGNFFITVSLASLGLPPWLAASTSFVCSTIGKEVIWDGMLGRGCVDAKDVVANLSGALAGYGIARGIQLSDKKEDERNKAIMRQMQSFTIRR